MAKKKTMHSSKDIDEDDNADAKEFAKLIAHRISTAKVKTASPSRAQQKIQVRIVWTDPDGQHGLGYLSMYASAAEKGSTGPSLKNFIDDVFRIIKWSRDTSRGIYGNDNDWSSFHGEVWRELQKTTCLDATSQVHTLKSRGVHAIVKCAKMVLIRKPVARPIRRRPSSTSIGPLPLRSTMVSRTTKSEILSSSPS